MPTNPMFSAVNTVKQRYLPRQSSAAPDAEPWPWCPKAERELSAGGVEGETITVSPVPHDPHVVNEGNTRCAGYPGEIPGIPIENLYSEIKVQRERADRVRREAAIETARFDALLEVLFILKAAEGEQ